MSETETDVVSLSSADAHPHSSRFRPATLAQSSVLPEHAGLTRLIGRGRFVKLPQLGEDAILSLHLRSEARDGERPETGEIGLVEDGAMTLAGQVGTMRFTHGVRLMRALSGIDLRGETGAGAERWQWLQAALMARLASTPFDLFDRAVHGATNTATDIDATSFTLRVTLRTSHHAIQTDARADAAVWRALLAHMTWEQELLPESTCLDLPYIATIRIARHTMPAFALRGVGAGDVVVPSSSSFACNGEGSVAIGSARVRVRYHAPCAIEIIARERNVDSMELEENILQQVADTPNTGYAPNGADTTRAEYRGDAAEAALPSDDIADATDLDAIPITLDFELGQAQMPLGEMRSLGAGTILTLTGGSPASIAIRSAGRLLGRGEVVDVNGQLGIRITQWGTPG